MEMHSETSRLSTWDRQCAVAEGSPALRDTRGPGSCYRLMELPLEINDRKAAAKF